MAQKEGTLAFFKGLSAQVIWSFSDMCDLLKPFDSSPVLENWASFFAPAGILASWKTSVRIDNHKDLAVF